LRRATLGTATLPAPRRTSIGLVPPSTPHATPRRSEAADALRSLSRPKDAVLRASSNLRPEAPATD
jgi:hypothetical protein